MRRKNTEDVFATSEAQVPYLQAREVARALHMDPWRLQKFLNGKRYRLTPEGGQLGKGQGSRRLFNHQDIYRLGIANRLIEDGFSPSFVSGALQQIEEHELLEIDQTGQPEAADVGFWRGENGPKVEFVSGRPSVAVKDGPYYVLRLSDLFPEIEKAIMHELKAR